MTAAKKTDGAVRLGYRWKWRSWVPYALLASGFGLSLAVTCLIAADARERAEAAFVASASEIRQHVQEGLNVHMELLEACAALLRANSEINGQEFRAFLNELNLNERYPGLLGIGFAQRVPQREVASFLRLVRLEGATGMRIWPGGARSDYYPLVFLEPNRAASQATVGFDIATDAPIRAAMDRARDTGEPAVTPDTTLTFRPHSKGHPGFAVLLPVYSRSAPIQTVSQRRRALVGFVYGPFRPDALQLDLVDEHLSIAISLSRGRTVDGTALTQGSSAIPAQAQGLASIQRVTAADQEWLVEVRSAASPSAALTPLAQSSLAVGLLVSTLVFLVTHAQGRAGAAQARHAAELQAATMALQASEAELRRLILLEQEARALAQTADRAKDEFLATLSHELRTPLNAILGWTSMLAQGAVTTERRANALDIIGRNARLQAQLVDDLLDVSRITTGNLRLDHQPFSIATVVAAAIESFRPVAAAKGVHLAVDASEHDLVMTGDPTRVQQIVSNLLSNGIKFTPAGGHVIVEVFKDDLKTHIRVRDTGPGIAPDLLPHVFERFRQGDSSPTRAHSGLGLGLAIAQHLAERHGGTIEAHSEGVGKGTQFVVQFPHQASKALHTAA